MSRHPIGCDPAEFASLPISDLLRRQAAERRNLSLPTYAPTPSVPLVGSTNRSAAHVQQAPMPSRDHLRPTNRHNMPSSPASSRNSRDINAHRKTPSYSRRQSLVDPDLAGLGFLDEIFTEIRCTIPNRKTVTGRGVFEAACNRLTYLFIGHLEDVQEAMQKEREDLFLLERQRRAREEEARRQAAASERRRRRTTAHSPVRVPRHHANNDSSWHNGYSGRLSTSPPLRRHRRTTRSPSPHSRHRVTTSPVLSSRRYCDSSPTRRRFRSPSETRKYRSPSATRQHHRVDHHRSSPIRKRHRSPSTHSQRESSVSPPRRRPRSQTPVRRRRRVSLGYSTKLSERPTWRSTENDPSSSSQSCETSPVVFPSFRSRKARMSEPVRRAMPPRTISEPLAQSHDIRVSEGDVNKNESLRQSYGRRSCDNEELSSWDQQLRKPSANAPNLNEELVFNRLEQAQKCITSAALDKSPCKDLEAGIASTVDESEDSSDDGISLPIVLPRPHVMGRSLVSDFTSLTPVIYDDDDGSSTEEERRINSRNVRSRLHQVNQYYDEDGRLRIPPTVSRTFVRRLRIDSCYGLNTNGTEPVVYQIETPSMSGVSNVEECVEIALRHNIVPFRREDMNDAWSGFLSRPHRRVNRPPTRRSTDPKRLHVKESENNADVHNSSDASAEQVPVAPSNKEQRQDLSPEMDSSSKLHKKDGCNALTGSSETAVINKSPLKSSKVGTGEKILPDSENVTSSKCTVDRQVANTVVNSKTTSGIASLKENEHSILPVGKLLIGSSDHISKDHTSEKQQAQFSNDIVSDGGIATGKEQNLIIGKSADCVGQEALLKGPEKLDLPKGKTGVAVADSFLEPNKMVMMPRAQTPASDGVSKNPAGTKVNGSQRCGIESLMDTKVILLPGLGKPDENSQRIKSDSSSSEEGELTGIIPEKSTIGVNDENTVAPVDDPCMVKSSGDTVVRNIVLEEGKLSYDDVIDATESSSRHVAQNAYDMEGMKLNFEVNPEQFHGRQVSGTLNVDQDNWREKNEAQNTLYQEKGVVTQILPKKRARNGSLLNGFMGHTQLSLTAENVLKNHVSNTIQELKADVEIFTPNTTEVKALSASNVQPGTMVLERISNPQLISQRKLVLNSKVNLPRLVSSKSNDGDRMMIKRPNQAGRTSEITEAGLKPGLHGSPPMLAMTPYELTMGEFQTMPSPNTMPTAPMTASRSISNSFIPPGVIHGGALEASQVCQTGRFLDMQNIQTVHQVQPTLGNNPVLTVTEPPIIDGAIGGNRYDIGPYAGYWLDERSCSFRYDGEREQ